MNNEKIDLVLYSDDPLEYIARALSPAKVISVETNDSLKVSQVIVPDDKLSLAIGKNGQNVRLAAKLTGWKIDVKAEISVEGSAGKVKDVDFELSELSEDDNNQEELEPISFDEFSSLDDIE